MRASAIPITQARPSQAVEKLAEHRAADQPSEEIAGQVDPAGRAAIGRRGATDEAGGCGLGEKRPDADKHETDQHRRKIRQQQQRQAEPASASAPQSVGCVPKRCTARPANGVVTIDGRKTK